MRRAWQVHPDQIYELLDGRQVPTVSRDRLVEALLDGAAFLDHAGGTLSVIVGRHTTDLPGEAITTGAVVEWKSGPRAPAEEEVTSAVPIVAQPTQTAPFTGTPYVEEQPEVEQPPVVAVDALDDDEIPDGLDEAALPEEDDSSIPVELR